MKYTIAKMFQILRHNRWVSILMIIEIALGMSVFTYSLNMFFSLSREKENQKNQERDLVLEISGGEGMNDIEKQAFTLKDYEKVDEITDGQTFLYVVLPQFYSYKNENYEFVMILVDYKKLDLKNGYTYWGNGLQDIMNCEMNPIPQLEKKQMPTKIAELNWKTETDEIKLKKCVVAPITYMEQYKEEISSAAIHVEWKKKYLKNEEKTIQKIETYLYNSHDQSFRYRIYSPEIELRNNTIKVMTSLQAINKVALLFMAVFLTGMIAIYQLRFEHRERVESDVPKCIPFRSTFRKEGLYLKKVTHTVLKYTNKSVDILGHGKEKCGCRYMDITVPVQRSSILTVAYRKLSGTVTSMRWHLRIFLRIRRQVRTLTDPDIPFWWRMS